MADTIKGIVAEIKAGKMRRGFDEKGTGGFWDYADEIAGKVYRIELNAKFNKAGCQIQDSVFEELQEQIYYALWEVVESCEGKDFD